MHETQEASQAQRVRRRHLLFGWWALAIFALLGTAMEAMHGFKVDWFLDPGFETRRLLWRLAHAHGTLLGLVQLGFAASVAHAWPKGGRGLELASRALLLAGILLPLGFFAGGIRIYGGDPGPGILVAPVGAAALVIGLFTTAWAVTFRDDDSPRSSDP